MLNRVGGAQGGPNGPHLGRPSGAVARVTGHLVPWVCGWPTRSAWAFVVAEAGLASKGVAPE